MSIRDRRKASKKVRDDEETKFKAMARRNKCSACGPPKSSANGTDADTYAKEVVQADFEEVGTMMCSARCAPFRCGRVVLSDTQTAASWMNCGGCSEQIKKQLSNA
ncbi:DUF1476 family protein (plasmid) [Sinorhizobium meliloti]|nr:DUF1476 family protein [Sinorhizobium meliloti]